MPRDRWKGKSRPTYSFKIGAMAFPLQLYGLCQLTQEVMYLGALAHVLQVKAKERCRLDGCSLPPSLDVIAKPRTHTRNGGMQSLREWMEIEQGRNFRSVSAGSWLATCPAN